MTTAKILMARPGVGAKLRLRAHQPLTRIPWWRTGGDTSVVLHRAGDHVARRSLDFYDAVGRALAIKGNA